MESENLLHPATFLCVVDADPLCSDTTESHTKMVRRIFLLLLFLVALGTSPAQERTYGRSMVVTPYGIVATSYVQASQAGARILERGGSAIDAGIAANAVLGVAEPMMNGMGGDLFAI